MANSLSNYRKKASSVKHPWRVCRWRWRGEKWRHIQQVAKSFSREAKTGARTRSRRIGNSAGRTEQCWRQSPTVLREERDGSCCKGRVYEMWTCAVAGGFAKWNAMLGKDSGVMSLPSCLICVENVCLWEARNGYMCLVLSENPFSCWMVWTPNLRGH